MNPPDEEETSRLAGSAIVDKDIPVELLATNAAGFMCIISIDIDTDTITFRSPCPVTANTLPSRYLLVGSVKWIE